MPATARPCRPAVGFLAACAGLCCLGAQALAQVGPGLAPGSALVPPPRPGGQYGSGLSGPAAVPGGALTEMPTPPGHIPLAPPLNLALPGFTDLNARGVPQTPPLAPQWLGAVRR